MRWHVPLAKARLRVALDGLRHFRRDDRGAISTETVLIIPLLVWAMMAMFVFWDAFKVRNTHTKATFAVADMITREVNPITPAYVNGVYDIFRFISVTGEDTAMRITSIQYRANNDTYRVLWSRSTAAGTRPPLVHNDLIALRDRLPVMTDADTIILVEAWRDYSPLFSVGVPGRTFHQFTVTRPRFISPIPFASS